MSGLAPEWARFSRELTSVAYRHYPQGMTDPRLYFEGRLRAGESLTLDKDASHYLISVMRRSEGESIKLFNEKDGEWQARIHSANRKAAIVDLEEQLRAPLSVPDVELLFAPVKKARTDFIVEKATELGARRIRPVITQRTNAERVRIDRLTALAREAAEQTERFDIPEISEAEKLARVLDQWPSDRVLIFCDEAGNAQPMYDVLRDRVTDKAAILIGPEGGFTPEERALIRSQATALPVSLGPRILRADTAAASALTIWQSYCGDWQAKHTSA